MTRPKVTYDGNLMGSLYLFRGASPESIESYFEKCAEKRMIKGEVLLAPHTQNNHLYIILSGRLLVHLDSLEAPPLLALDPGECTGEMSLIEHKAPSAFVVAAEDTHLLVIDHDTLLAMINASHDVAKNLLFILSHRLRTGNDFLVDSMEMQRQFEHYATVDALTGLHNRRWLDDMFAREVKRCVTDGRPLCLAMLDLDNFKSFNDNYGHLSGDRALRVVAGLMQLHIRPNDMLARYGGEEFAILLPETRIGEATGIAERIRVAIMENTEEITGKAARNPITASLGLAQLKDGDTLETLIQSADKAMYRAKSLGKNRVV